MIRLLMKFMMFFAIFLLLTPSETSALNHINKKSIPIQNKTKEQIIGEIPEANIILYAREREGYFEKFKLMANGDIQYFPGWMNISNEAYKPKLFFSDINSDGKKELIIILTTGYGTGIIQQNVHVLHNIKTGMGEIYKEKIVDDPRAILLKNVKTKLTKSEAIINIKNKKIVINIDKLDIAPEHLFSNIVMDNLIKFDVLDNELTAIVGAQISPVGGYIGSFYITYAFKDNMYQLKKINFIPNSK